MIGVDINSNQLAVKEGAQIDMEFFNSVFDESLITGEYILPFELPNNGNGKAFSFIHNLFSRYRIKRHDNALIKYKGDVLFPAIIDIQETTDQKINVTARLNFTALTCLSKKLSEFDYGGIYNMGADQNDVLAYVEDMISKAYPDTSHNFPMIYNPEIYGGNSPTYYGYLNLWNIITQSVAPNINTGTTVNQNALVPMLYLHYIIKQAFLSDGYTLLDEGFMADTDKKKLMIYNNKTLDEFVPVTTPTGLHTTLSDYQNNGGGMGPHIVIFDDETSTGNYDTAGAYNNTTGEYVVPSSGNYTVQTKVDFVASVLNGTGPSSFVAVRIELNGVVQVSQNLTFQQIIHGSLTVSGSFTATAGDIITVTLRILTGSAGPGSQIKPGSYLTINGGTVLSDLNNFKKTYNLAEHVPDVTFGELINAVRQTFCLAFDFDHINKTIAINYLESKVRTAPVQYTNQSLEGHTIRFGEYNNIKSINFDFGSNDSLADNNFKKIDPTEYYGDYNSLNDVLLFLPANASNLGKKVYLRNQHQFYVCAYDSGISAYRWQYYTDAYTDYVFEPTGQTEIKIGAAPLLMANTGTFLTCAIYNRGNTTAFDTGVNDFPLRFFYYHGLTNYATFGGASAPTTSSTQRGIFGQDLSSTGLQFKDTSLLPLLKTWIDIKQRNEIIIKKVRMSLYDLKKFNITSVLLLDGAAFLVKKQNISIGDEIQPVELELYQL